MVNPGRRYADEDLDEYYEVTSQNADPYFSRKRQRQEAIAEARRVRFAEQDFQDEKHSLLSSLGDCAKLLERATHSHQMQESTRGGLLGDIDDWFMANQLGRYKDRPRGYPEESI